MSIWEDIQVILDKDPAARTKLEVVLCYPGFHAVVLHRLAHWFWQEDLLLIGRMISHLSRVLTGIEIHPGAKIGHRLFIDHGMGVVIGETAVVGDDVVLYQGVTLGAGAEARMGALTRGKKRHPTLGNGVVVGSGAEIQGAISIGDQVRVASRSVVLKDVPANSVVVGVPGRVIFQEGKKIASDHADPEAEAIKHLRDTVAELQNQVARLSGQGPTNTETKQSQTPDSKTKQSEPENPVESFLQGAGI